MCPRIRSHLPRVRGLRLFPRGVNPGLFPLSPFVGYLSNWGGRWFPRRVWIWLASLPATSPVGAETPVILARFSFYFLQFGGFAVRWPPSYRNLRSHCPVQFLHGWRSGVCVRAGAAPWASSVGAKIPTNLLTRTWVKGGMLDSQKPHGMARAFPRKGLVVQSA